MTIGIVGTFTAHHIAMIRLQEILDVRFKPVPFQGAVDQNIALMGGHIEAMIGNLNDIMRDMEKFRMLAIATEKRHSWVKDVPTFKELGLNFTSNIRRVFAVPAKTAPVIVQKLRDGFHKLLNDPECVKEMEKTGQPSEYLSGEEFAKYIDNYYAEAKVLIEKYELNKKK